jgi:hypothetical protein
MHIGLVARPVSHKFGLTDFGLTTHREGASFRISGRELFKSAKSFVELFGPRGCRPMSVQMVRDYNLYCGWVQVVAAGRHLPAASAFRVLLNSYCTLTVTEALALKVGPSCPS